MGENNGSTIDSIVLAKVARGRSSPRTTRNADWLWRRFYMECTLVENCTGDFQAGIKMAQIAFQFELKMRISA